MTTTITPKPFALKLSGHGFRVFQEVCTHVRNGYVVAPDIAPEFMPGTGEVLVTLILGEPQKFAEADAEASIQLAKELERAEFDRQVKVEAQRIVAADKAAAIKSRLAAESADHAKAIQKLERELAASLAAQAAIL